MHGMKFLYHWPSFRTGHFLNFALRILNESPKYVRAKIQPFSAEPKKNFGFCGGKKKYFPIAFFFVSGTCFEHILQTDFSMSNV